MEHKNQDSYERLFDAVEQHAASLTTPSVPDPSLVIIDFKAAVVGAVRQVFGDTTEVHGCFFHLTQSTWRKIQTLGLSTRYREDSSFRHFCGMLDGLAFLHEDDVVAGLAWLRTVAPDGTDELVPYFDETYVTGCSRHLPTTTVVWLACVKK